LANATDHLSHRLVVCLVCETLRFDAGEAVDASPGEADDFRLWA